MPVFSPVQDYVGLYIVSDEGRIWSRERTRSDGRFYKERELRPGKSTNGYLYVTLWKNGLHKRIAIHRIVARAFLLAANDKACVNHIDGNRHNNAASNLEWCTHSENSLDGFKRGRVIWNKGVKKYRPSLICEWCGLLFAPKRGNQVLCSRKCTGQRNGNIKKHIENKLVSVEEINGRMAE